MEIVRRIGHPHKLIVRRIGHPLQLLEGYDTLQFSIHSNLYLLLNANGGFETSLSHCINPTIAIALALALTVSTYLYSIVTRPTIECMSSLSEFDDEILTEYPICVAIDLAASTGVSAERSDSHA